MTTLSIVIPAYNESATILKILQKLKDCDFSGQIGQTINKEIIVINDCSTDKTSELASQFARENKGEKLIIKVLDNEQNMGKSQSVKRGILASNGDWVVIQDADLEYEPTDLIELLKQGIIKDCDVVYGNRFGQYNDVIYWKNFLGNLALSCFSNLFTIGNIRVFIPDMEVCYKMVKGTIFREVAATISSKSNFGFEPEITAKLGHYCKKVTHLKFLILPISYNPRSIADGKKMKAFRDGIKAFWEIIHFNLFP